MSEVEDEIRRRDTSIQEMEEDVIRLQTGVNDLSRELEAKGKEILSNRSDFNLRLK